MGCCVMRYLCIVLNLCDTGGFRQQQVNSLNLTVDRIIHH